MGHSLTQNKYHNRQFYIDFLSFAVVLYTQISPKSWYCTEKFSDTKSALVLNLLKDADGDANITQ